MLRRNKFLLAWTPLALKSLIKWRCFPGRHIEVALVTVAKNQNVQVRLATRICSLIRVSLKTSTSTLRQARQDRCTFTYKVLGISWNRGFVLLPLAPENYTRENQVSQIEPARGDIENSPTDNLLGKKTHLNVKVNNCRAS